MKIEPSDSKSGIHSLHWIVAVNQEILLEYGTIFSQHLLVAHKHESGKVLTHLRYVGLILW